MTSPEQREAALPAMRIWLRRKAEVMDYVVAAASPDGVLRMMAIYPGGVEQFIADQEEGG